MRLTINEAAEYAGVHPDTIRYAISQGRLLAHSKSQRKRWLTTYSVDKWLENEGYHKVGRPRKLPLDRRENIRDNIEIQSENPGDHPGYTTTKGNEHG